MTELLLLTPTAILGYLLWRADRRYDKVQGLLEARQSEWKKLHTATIDEWTEDRNTTRDRYESERAKLLEEIKEERSEWAKERAQLLNRIQRPDTAVYENFEPSNLKQYAGFDNDEEAWEAVNGDS